VGDHDLLDEVKIRRGCAASCYAAKESKHFISERIVASELTKIGNEENDSDINARNNEQRARDVARQCDVAFACCRKRFQCDVYFGFNSQRTLMIFQSPLNLATSR